MRIAHSLAPALNVMIVVIHTVHFIWRTYRCRIERRIDVTIW